MHKFYTQNIISQQQQAYTAKGKEEFMSGSSKR